MPGTDRLRLNQSHFIALALPTLAGATLALVLASSGTAAQGNFCNGKPVDKTLTGDTTYTGSPGPDVVAGDGGEQTTHLHGGDDTVCGGGGNDDLQVGQGDDDVFGEGGEDILRGRPGTDELHGDFDQNSTASNTARQGKEDDCRGGKPRPDTPPNGDRAFDCERSRSVIPQ